MAEENLVAPKTDQDYLALCRWVQRYSTCLKTQTAALIVQNGKILSFGYNMCCPQGQIYGMPVSECPREKIKTGANYELCKPIHAEVVAVINAIGISPAKRRELWHFPGFTLQLQPYFGFFKGAVLYLVGHYWACQECQDFARLMGIDEIVFDNLTAGETLKKYISTGLVPKEKHHLDVSGCILSGAVTVKIEPADVDEFCRRHNLEGAVLFQLGEQYLVNVSSGEERNAVERFSQDPSVREARLLYTA